MRRCTKGLNQMKVSWYNEVYKMLFTFVRRITYLLIYQFLLVLGTAVSFFQKLFYWNFNAWSVPESGVASSRLQASQGDMLCSFTSDSGSRVAFIHKCLRVTCCVHSQASWWRVVFIHKRLMVTCCVHSQATQGHVLRSFTSVSGWRVALCRNRLLSGSCRAGRVFPFGHMISGGYIFNIKWNKTQWASQQLTIYYILLNAEDPFSLSIFRFPMKFGC